MFCFRAKLQQELNQLDRSLYRDLIRKSQAHKHPVHHSRLMGGKRFVGRRGKPHFNMKGAGASGSLARQGSHSSIGSARSGRSGPIFSHHDSFTSQSDAGYDEEEDNAERSERAATEYTGGAKIVKNEDLIKMNQKKQQFEASLRQFGGVDRDGSLKGNDSTDNGADNQSQTITVESMYKGESRPVSTMMFSAHPPVSAGQSANHRNTHVNFTNSPSRATLPNSSRAGLHPHPPHPSATGSATTPHRPTRPSVAHTPSSASRGVSSYGRKITTPSKDVRPLPQETSPPHGNSAEHDNASHIPPELHIDSRHLDDGESMQHFLLRQNHTFKRNHIHDVVEDQDAVEKAEANHEHNHHHQHGHHHKPDVKISVLQDSHSFGSQDAMDPVLMPDGQVMNGATDVSVLVFGESNGVPVLLATHDIVQEVKDPATESEPKTSTEEAEAAQDEVDHNILRKMNLIENMMQTAQQKKLQAKLAAEAEAEKIAMYSDDPAKRPGDAFRDDFLHENRPTTQYFVSSIHTLASKASKSTGVEEIKPLPYRDRELKSKHMKKHVSKTVSTVQASVGDQSQILQLEHLTCNLAEKRELPPVLERDNNKIVSGFKDKLQGEEMLEEFRNLHVNKASIIEARRARKAIEADMSVVRDVVVSVSLTTDCF